MIFWLIHISIIKIFVILYIFFLLSRNLVCPRIFFVSDNRKYGDYNMGTKTILPFTDTVCSDVRKILDAIFKDCRHQIGIGNWGVWYWCDKWNNCVVMDNAQYKIDIRYDNKEKTCSLSVKGGNNESYDLTLSGFEWIGKEYTQIIRQTEFNSKEIKQRVLGVINEIDCIKK